MVVFIYIRLFTDISLISLRSTLSCGLCLREVVQSTREAVAALHRRNPAVQPLLAIVQVL